MPSVRAVSIRDDHMLASPIFAAVFASTTLRTRSGACNRDPQRGQRRQSTRRRDRRGRAGRVDDGQEILAEPIDRILAFRCL